MPRLLVLVDGLNLFHSLKQQDAYKTKLDISSLVRQIHSSTVDAVEIRYYTYLVEHLDNQSRNAQFTYIQRLMSTGVFVSLGQFRSQTAVCPICGSKYWSHQEKQTDVALASELIKQIFSENCDRVFIFSADSDFLPAIAMVVNEKPKVELKVISTPQYLRPIHGALAKLGVSTIRLSVELVAKHQFS